MKHYIIFIIVFSLPCAITHTMKKEIQKHENRSLRDELLFAQAIRQQFNVPRDIIHAILYTSYLLRDINTLSFRYGRIDTEFPKKKLCFELLSQQATIDFLYLTNKQEMMFLKMEPAIINRAAEIAWAEKKPYIKGSKAIWCINIVKTDANYDSYLKLPEKIKDLSWWFVKEYDG